MMPSDLATERQDGPAEYWSKTGRSDDAGRKSKIPHPLPWSYLLQLYDTI